MSNNNLEQNGCYQGTGNYTPIEVKNAPNLPAISYRTGTYSQFRHTMLSQLSDGDIPALSALQTRASDDFSIALVDAWSVVCDVLTFYQERIANESYTRTATERTSLVQLARSASYELEPGLAAETYLAFTIEDISGAAGQAVIDRGTKVQSLPNPGEKPQVFETDQAIEAHAAWNAIRPRKMRSQKIKVDTPSLLLQGIATGLQPGDVLLLIIPVGNNGTASTTKALRRVQRIVIDPIAQQTTVLLEAIVLQETGGGSLQSQGQSTPNPSTGPATHDSVPGNGASGQQAASKSAAGSVIDGASANRTSSTLDNVRTLTNTTVDTLVRHRVWKQRDLDALISTRHWPVQDVLTSIAAQTRDGPLLQESQTAQVFVFRARASLFGYNASDWQALPEQVRRTYYNRYKAANPNDTSNLGDFTDWPFMPTVPEIVLPNTPAPPMTPQNKLDLDKTYPQLLHNSWVAITKPDGTIAIVQVDSAVETGATGYALNAKVTRLKLQATEKLAPASMVDIRQTTMYGQSEPLVLAELPDDTPVQGNTIDVLGLYYGLRAGRTLIVAGELADLSGVQQSEVVTLAESVFDTSVRGGMTTFTLADSLANVYKPQTVTIYGNITPATQGETVQDEILGDGDASQAYQSFTLRQFPLTFLHGGEGNIVSTLNVFVNGISWQEVPSLLPYGPGDRVYTKQLDEDGKATIRFGDGRTGARLPDGLDNVRASYRKGSGSSGRVNADQLTQLMTRPLGVKSVTNPLPPTGAKDPETIDNARSSAALNVLTMGRIVSLQDYEHFARTFLGIAKVLATPVSTGGVPGLCVTIAGPDGQVIAEDQPLYKRLFTFMRAAGDPYLSLSLQAYTLVLFRIEARVTMEKDASASAVREAVQQAILTRFSFDNRAFSQPVTMREVVATIQDAPGVASAVVSSLYRVDQDHKPNDQLDAALPSVAPDGNISLAQLLIADSVPFDVLEVIS